MPDEPTKQEESTPVVPVAVEIRAAIKEEVEKEQNKGEVRRKVVFHFTHQEVGRRTDLLVKALDKRSEVARELGKIRPDTVHYAEDGVKQPEFFSKPKHEERKKCKERLVKIDKAINNAIEKADYDGLQNIMQKGSKDTAS